MGLPPAGPTFTFEQSNKTHLTSSASTLHLRDPYEIPRVIVKASSVASAGRGVFAVRDLRKDSVVCFYNGVRMSEKESVMRKADRKSPYRIENDWAQKNQVRA